MNISIKVISLVCFFIFHLNVFTQSIKYDPPETKEVMVNYIDSVAIINIKISNKNIKAKDDVIYYWYFSNMINNNVGGFEGNILHGNYSLLLKDGKLLVKGSFTEGVKDNVWKYWYNNGNIKEIQNWEKGNLNGVNIIYDIYGNKLLEANYKDGLLDGAYISYYKDTVIKKNYKKGKEIISKPLFGKREERNFKFRLFKNSNDTISKKKKLQLINKKEKTQYKEEENNEIETDTQNADEEKNILKRLFKPNMKNIEEKTEKENKQEEVSKKKIKQETEKKEVKPESDKKVYIIDAGKNKSKE